MLEPAEIPPFDPTMTRMTRFIPAQRGESPETSVPAPKTRVRPVPVQRTNITQTARALSGYTVSYEIGIKDSRSPLTQKAVERFVGGMLEQMRGIKYLEALELEKDT